MRRHWHGNEFRGRRKKNATEPREEDMVEGKCPFVHNQIHIICLTKCPFTKEPFFIGIWTCIYVQNKNPWIIIWDEQFARSLRATNKCSTGSLVYSPKKRARLEPEVLDVFFSKRRGGDFSPQIALAIGVQDLQV